MQLGIAAIILGFVGFIVLSGTHAATPSAGVEAESGARVGNVALANDTSASGAAAVKFGASGGTSQTPLCSGMSNWSNAASWAGAGVPTANSNVTLPAGASIQVDVDTPHLNRVTIPTGTTLCFPNRAATFSAKQIIVLGTFQAGTPTNRLTSNLTIKLEGGAPGDNDFYTVTGQAATAIDQYNIAHSSDCAPAPMGCINVGKNIGTNFLSAHDGGTLSIYGSDSGLTWSDLASTSPAGSSTINLRDAVTWQPGDSIVVASSDFDWTHEERKIVGSVSNGGKTITLTTPLTYTHSGISTCQTLSGETRCVDERAEVGLLSHNLKITGPDDAAANDGFGGQVINLAGGHVGMDGVEMYHMGQKGYMARYPLHFHIMGDDGKNVNVSNISIHDSYNRFVDFHGSNYAHLSGLVADDTIGHGIMFEDGDEHDNTLTHNLVGGVQFNPTQSQRLRLSDEAPSAIWITNADNNFIGNHTFGSDGNGIWVDYIDDASRYDIQWDTWAGTFNDNVSHSDTGKSGLTSLEPHEQGNGIFVGGYIGTPNQATAVYRNSAWKNKAMGYWIDGAVTFTDSTAANNTTGVTMQNSHMSGGLFMYVTANTEAGALSGGYGDGLLRAYHGAADYENIWLAGYGGTSDTKLMSAITDGAAGITDHPPRIKAIKFFGPGYKVLFDACPYTTGGTTSWGACYWGMTHAGNSHIMYDMDGSIKGDGVPVAITNAESFNRYGNTWVDTNVTGTPYGTTNRGMITPFSYKYMEYNPINDDASSYVIRDSDGLSADTGGWMMLRTGDRYFLNSSKFVSTFDFAGLDSGYVDVYENAPSKPTSVQRCIYNTLCNGREGYDNFTQPEASSLANLGVDGTWWYGNGKLYIRVQSSGSVPFGLANSTYVNGDQWGQGEFWTVTL